MTTETQMVRTTFDLLNVLFDELDALRNNRSSVAHANSVARLAHQTCHVVKTDLDFRRLLVRMAPSDQKAVDIAAPGPARQHDRAA